MSASSSDESNRHFEETVRILGDLETRRRGALQGSHSEILSFMRRAGDDFFRLLNERNLSPDLSKQEGITLGLSIRALTTFYAIVDMLELSLSLQALAIHRSLFDLMLQTRWLHQDPETRCERYIDYDTLHRWYYLKYISRWGEIEDPELLLELTTRLAPLCRKYGVIGEDVEDEAFAVDADALTNQLKKEHFYGGATGTWHGKSMADLVQEVGKTFPAGMTAGEIEAPVAIRYRLVEHSQVGLLSSALCSRECVDKMYCRGLGLPFHRDDETNELGEERGRDTRR